MTTVRGPASPQDIEQLDEQLEQLVEDQAFPYFWFPEVLCVLAAVEWMDYLRDAPRTPIAYTIIAFMAVDLGAVRLFQLRRKFRRLRLGRDGERVDSPLEDVCEDKSSRQLFYRWKRPYVLQLHLIGCLEEIVRENMRALNLGTVTATEGGT